MKVKSGYAKFLPEFAPLNVTLEEEPGRRFESGRVGHMGIQVDDRATVETHLSRIKESGLAVLEQFGVDCCYANQDKLWVEDPDGAKWEIYVLNHDIEEKNCASAECEAPIEQKAEPSACCAPTCCS